MAVSVEYRGFAEEQRRAAEGARLPMVRMRHLEAAESWDRLAEELEWLDTSPRRARQEMIY
ncbi:MAG: hypothetical protein AB7F98_13190 [Novosphingobium sp.]